MTSLFKLLGPTRKTAVVDVGAQFIPVDGQAPYKPMLLAGVCTLVGFEPQTEACTALKAFAGEDETYLPMALGDGTARTLHVCVSSGMTSLLKPNPLHLGAFNDLAELGTVIQEIPVQTHRLDDIAEIAALDFLKIDVQGAELEVFRNGRERLSSAVAVQTEVSLVTMYQDQPTFADVDRELRSLGMIPHCIEETKYWPISPARVNNNSRMALRQVVEMDMVYVRDFTDVGNMTAEQWKHLALIAHYAYGSYDLAVRAIWALIKLGEVTPATYEAYFNLALAERAAIRDAAIKPAELERVR